MEIGQRVIVNCQRDKGAIQFEGRKGIVSSWQDLKGTKEEIKALRKDNTLIPVNLDKMGIFCFFNHELKVI